MRINTNKPIRLYTLLYMWLLATSLTGAVPIVFSNYMAADGLSDNNVLCGLRDRFGFMWLGTNNGLNCFDGVQNTIYRNMIEGKSGIENNTITALYEHGDDIWFGGSFGLYVYDRQTNRFKSFDKCTKYGVSISATVQDIVGGQDGCIWIGTQGQGLFIYNPKTDELTQDSRHGAFISDILAENDSPVFVATLQGHIILYRQDGTFLMEHSIPDYRSDKNNISLELIGFRLYIGCERGLYTVLRDNGEVTAVPQVNIGIHSLLRKGNQLLMGTDQGIYLYNPTTQQMRRFDNPEDKITGLTDQRVNALTWDKDSTLWVMTQGGVCYMPQRGNDVLIAHFPESGRGSMIYAICETADGRLWIGHENGLGIYNPATQLIDEYPAADLKQEVNVLMSDGNDLWIGTRRQGVFVLNTINGQLRHYQYSADKSYTVPSNEITCLLRTSEGVIYVGTSWGLCRFERETENFMWYFEIGSTTRVTSLTQDKDGCVWASTSNHGLFKQWEKGGTFRNFTYQQKEALSLANNNVSTVFCDHSGQIWVAYTGTGLARYQPRTESFEPVGTDIPEIQDQQIFFIVEDLQHNLWMGVETGMLRLDASRNVSTIQVLRGSSDMNRQLKPHNSASITRNGEMFAGRFNILAHFYPDRINIATKRAPVYITHLTSTSTLTSTMLPPPSTINHPPSTITLPYSDNGFTLHFSQPLFNGSNSQRRFEYRMEGIDATWAKGTKNAEATYVNVPPGDYVFLLREAGNTDESSYARLNITILPPWYRTNLAYFIYFLLIVSAIAWLLYRYNSSMKKRYNRRLKEYQTAQEKANFESKIRFFVDIVHEIRTPLTLISLPLEQIEESPLSDENRRHTSAIRRNMNYLLGITNQLLDFQKAEHGKIQLNLHSCDVGQLLSETFQQFTDAMEVQGKRIQLQLPEEPIVTTIDADKVQKVIMNLIGNAAKYARSEIIVRLELLPSANDQTAIKPNDLLRISVIDDGPGVPKEERDKIFDLYYQIGNENIAATLGTGLGLSYAKMLAQAHDGELTYSDAVGGGSHFQLVLPISSSSEESLVMSEISPVDNSHSTDEHPIVNTNHCILIVEDNEELLQMTTDALRPHFRILKAHDGIEALDVLKYNNVDVIVSDVMMPRMDGIELCTKVKDDINYSHIPVILLTAKTSVEAKVEGMQSGADIYLEKPFSIKQLHLQILNLLRMRQTYYERMRNITHDANDEANTDNEGELGLTQQDMLFMERLQKMVAENMRDEEFSIDQLAEQMNMSRSSFYRKIKALTDMTPVDYLKMRRLEQAATLLRQGIRITEVAERVGFTSSSYFAKCFKSRFGVLPKDFIAR